MADLIGNIILILLAILGLTAGSQFLLRWWMRPKGKEKITVVLPIRGHDESVEYTLRSLISQYRWSDEAQPGCQILCLDHEMDEETRFICERIARNHPFIQICSPEQAAKWVRS